ncbi:MAG: hypothetical protein AB7G24_00825 [Novosphingobium sp.]
MDLMTMPAQIIAGDSLSLVLAAAAGDYPAADGWAVALTLTPMAGGAPVAVAATGGAASWDIALPSATSAGLAAGQHRWLIAATKAGERSTVAFGEVKILPNPAGAVDQRSAMRRALDAIDAVLESRAGSENIRFDFADGRSIHKVPHAELLELRKFYAGKVAAEQRGRTGPRRVEIRL